MMDEIKNKITDALLAVCAGYDEDALPDETFLASMKGIDEAGKSLDALDVYNKRGPTAAGREAVELAGMLFKSVSNSLSRFENPYAVAAKEKVDELAALTKAML